MFQGLSVASKKSLKKSQKKLTTKKPTLKSTCGTDLSESFYDKVETLEIGTSRSTTNYTDSNSFKCILSILNIFRLILYYDINYNLFNNSAFKIYCQNY